MDRLEAEGIENHLRKIIDADFLNTLSLAETTYVHSVRFADNTEIEAFVNYCFKLAGR